MIRTPHRRFAAGVVTALAVALIPGLVSAGFMASGFDARTSEGSTYVRIPASGISNGISHDLNPNNYVSFRVRVKHDDAGGPGWISDELTPVSGNIQICNEGGCEAPEIQVGNNLNWGNASRIHIYLEAKPAPLQAWEQYELSF